MLLLRNKIIFMISYSVRGPFGKDPVAKKDTFSFIENFVPSFRLYTVINL